MAFPGVGVSALAGVSGGATGSHVTPYASFWMPLSRSVLVGLGVGLTWSSGSFMHQRFGVTPADSEVSGLPVYTASAGLRKVYTWPAVVWRFHPRWFGCVGALYQGLTGDAANSPIVTERWKPNQWTVGGGVAYAFR